MTTLPLTLKVAFVLIPIGLIIFLIGFCSPYWTYREIHTKPSGRIRTYMDGYVSYGLWTFCRDTEEYYDRQTKSGLVKIDDCWSLVNNPGFSNAETRVAQFFETVGLLLVLASTVLLVISLFVDSCKDRRILPILSAVFCLSAAGTILLGTIIFGTADLHERDLAWAFALAIVGGIIFAIAGVFIIVGAILKK
ncbi:unnamed protein product [Candidula unifasciata]|uniref:Uncharacterized protein n=1 Tax=Candidula unifasciata TaxID=100452 RepID=A0A8S3ZTE6_9EUPU|nr:unnamed protein product [Candidula unifasciata]